MSTFRTLIESVLAATLVVLLGWIWMNYEFAGRIPLGVRVGQYSLGGLEASRVFGSLDAYEQEFAQSKVAISFRGAKSTHTFQELGIKLKKEETASRVLANGVGAMRIGRIRVIPAVSFTDDTALNVLHADFAGHMVIPKHSALYVDAKGVVRVLPAKNGEHIHMASLRHDISKELYNMPLLNVSASAVSAVPENNQKEIEQVRIFAQTLLQSGFRLTAFEDEFTIPGSAVATMMRFSSDAAVQVQFDEEKMKQYLAEHIVSQVERSPVNAKFQMRDGKVEQFALPEDGRSVNSEGTIELIQRALAIRVQASPIALEVIAPLIADTGDSEKLGISKMLARGETDFRGSPKNRIHNVEVGTSKYNGILIAPNEEFSFNAFLGPVTKEAGFLPELVIKNHVTTPEFGGGLCQVSTTAFRAAVHAGMKITSRRNHAYAVRYYGTPGFDATIYPPYTDFRFLNNTPGYILIQTKIDGTKLSFEFWGTDDKRTVEVDGPHPYNRQPDGSVKSVLKQTVKKESGEILFEKTFYSNYKSPNLFPHT